MRYIPYSVQRLSAMGTKFSDLLDEIEVEAHEAGPAAAAQFAALDERYHLAQKVMAARRAAGLSQATLAKMTGIGQADISRFERGRANPTVSTLAALAHGLGLGIELVPRETRGTSGHSVRKRPRAAV